MIVTGSDVSLKLRCNYSMSNRTLVSSHGQLEVEGGPKNKAGAEATVLTAPNVTLRVTDRQGRDIGHAKVGDPLSLTFEINDDDQDEKALFDIFVRDLVATDGVDASEIMLVDHRCGLLLLLS